MLQRSNQSAGRRPILRSMALAFPLALALLALSQSLALAQAPTGPPVIDQFQITEMMGGIWAFEGHVYDPDGPTEGYVVNFGGAVSGLSATCRSDGSFSEGFWIPGLTGGVSADTTDPQGAAADTRMFYVH